MKLTRTLLIVPIVLFYAWKRVASQRPGDRAIDWLGLFPWFILWFLAAAAVQSLGWIPKDWQVPLHGVALFVMVVALAGVGLCSDVRRMRAAGLRPLALGAILWIAIAWSSLAIAHVVRFG